MIGWGSTICRAALFVLFLVAGSPSPLDARRETASLRSSVSDPTGAPISDATVRLLDVDRGAETQVVTNSSGLYTFLSVRPGLYNIEVEKSGFKLARMTGLSVNVQDNFERLAALSSPKLIFRAGSFRSRVRR